MGRAPIYTLWVVGSAEKWTADTMNELYETIDATPHLNLSAEHKLRVKVETPKGTIIKNGAAMKIFKRMAKWRENRNKPYTLRLLE